MGPPRAVHRPLIFLFPVASLHRFSLRLSLLAPLRLRASAMAASPSPPSRWPQPRTSLRMGFLALLVGFLAASAPAREAEATGVLRQVVGGGDGGTFFEPFNVTYDHRAVILGGERRMLVSAGLHYPRATPEVSTEAFVSGAFARWRGWPRRRESDGVGGSGEQEPSLVWRSTASNFDRWWSSLASDFLFAAVFGFGCSALCVSLEQSRLRCAVGFVSVAFQWGVNPFCSSF